MKFYISASGIRRVTISNSGAGKGSAATVAPARRLTSRTLLPVVLVLGIVLPFLFVRVAFLVLESAAACSSSTDCIGGWRFFSGNDANMLREELTRALLEAEVKSTNTVQGMDGSLESFDELLSTMERKVHSARQRESMYWHLASHGLPKSLHCLCLKLAEEYAMNAAARSRLPSPRFVSRLSDPSLHHLVLLTDNVLAASVVISSTIKSSADPEKLVFHIVTDKKTYTPMHAWFAVNPVESAVVEVKGLHQYDWSREVNVGVKDMIDINQLIWKHYYDNLKEEDLEEASQQSLEALSPSNLSVLNYLCIYIPELFPDLNKVVFLDDDVVVQHDLSPLWGLDLNGKVVGAVVNSWCGDDCCPGRKYNDYINFSHPIISSNFASEADRCAWLYGMNIFDLEAWRRNNITKVYQQWLKLSLDSGLGLWKPGVLSPALIAFKGHVHSVDPLWHFDGLGHRFSEAHEAALEAAAVIHFSGPAKPWLEIGSQEVRSLWFELKSADLGVGPEGRRSCLQPLLPHVMAAKATL
ncbi:hypothetical protein CDL15_Pgr001425 [Punica granatum]|uniref:Hexosyltransferase n=1 Tax=Punica granatum TaxID=22663 RepID=A0A218WM40_PUNGR|nr:hypothetical protein CDL15_Pgr001425 [Punica granatum]